MYLLFLHFGVSFFGVRLEEGSCMMDGWMDGRDVYVCGTVVGAFDANLTCFLMLQEIVSSVLVVCDEIGV
jgi:hypothetical protein